MEEAPTTVSDDKSLLERSLPPALKQSKFPSDSELHEKLFIAAVLAMSQPITTYVNILCPIYVIRCKTPSVTSFPKVGVLAVIIRLIGDATGLAIRQSN